MGGCSICSSEVHFEQIDLKVPTRDLQTLAKFGKGAAERRKVMKMKLNSMNEVAALKKPVYPDDGREEIIFVDPVMITKEELDTFLNKPGGGLGLKWINTW